MQRLDPLRSCEEPRAGRRTPFWSQKREINVGDPIDVLVRQAELLQRQGSPTAAGVWAEVLRQAPHHPVALYYVAEPLVRNDPRRALELLAKAEAAAPAEALIPLAAARAYEAMGDAAARLAALDRALAADPYCYPALLQKASLVETRSPRSAAQLYTNALKITPPDERLPPALRTLAAHARDCVARDRDALKNAIDTGVASVRARHAGADFRRFDQARDTICGLSKVYRQDPTMLDFPELPPIEFYPREMFPWFAELEEATDSIAAEVVRILKEDDPEFGAYVQHPPGAPVNQWAELNFSRKWSAYFLWKDGSPVTEHQARCPRTTEVLSRMPLADVPGFAPAAFFSTLDPGAHIPPHTGVTNTRLVCHLPLIVPEGASFRVGAQTRPWRKGEAWVFDDSIEHEAFNRSAELRVILIFDVWNPLLTLAERDLVAAMLAARRAYYGG